ncbi:hypothetical protein GRI75_03545 [Altererythrobacter soli]|uniref:Uncharacterized protein n=1 Tax=Croceibacterium soli TaxID=1739690 RepID=A0A6I4USZ5_9SPHN|nr:hypothetical protein [Croceibacterium soli]MXP40723.1 hypothetical protein [Croceibacterium soli]
MATKANTPAGGSEGPNIPNKTRFVDLVENEKNAIHNAERLLGELNARKRRVEKLGEADANEHERLTELLALKDKQGPWIRFDPLFVALREALGRNDGNLAPVRIFHESGAILFDPRLPSEDEHNRQVVRTSLLYGLLSAGKAAVPPVVADGDRTRPDTMHPKWAGFLSAFYQSLGTIAGQMGLAQKVLSIIINDVRINSRQVAEVYAAKFAETMRVLIEKQVRENDPQLKPMVDQVIDRVSDFSASEEERPWHEVAIDLPDLNSWADNNVVAENVYLMGPMIFASMFEELKAFQVVDKLIELSQRGHISLPRGKAGTQLYEYWRQAPNRMSEVERQTFYAMTLGMPTGQPGAQVNTDFQDLWLRFVSSVSSLVRENRVDQLIRSSLPVSVNQQQVKKSARDLVANMSLYGYGMAYYAAIDLQKQINEMIQLLSDPDVKSSFGARDMWGVIDQIAQVELGGARNSSKYRTLATSGAIITRWLGDNLDRLRDPTLPVLELKAIENPPARLLGQSATSHPTDYDLINACELWLADSALDDMRVEQLSQPRESPQQPSRPIQMPSIARDLLEGTGLGLGMSYQPQATNGHDRSAYAGY